MVEHLRRLLCEGLPFKNDPRTLIKNPRDMRVMNGKIIAGMLRPPRQEAQSVLLQMIQVSCSLASEVRSLAEVISVLLQGRILGYLVSTLDWEMEEQSKV